MSTIVKFFTKSKKNSANKENQENTKRVNFERASTRSDVGASEALAERDRQAMRALPNPYSVWTEPKKTRGPSSCPGGVALDSSYFNERRSTRAPKQERAGSVYGGMSGMKQYRIDGPPLESSHHHQQHHRSSRRYGDLSMIEERSERNDRSMRQQQEDWNRSSQRRNNHAAHNMSYPDYTSGDSDDEGEYERRLRDKIYRLKDEKKGLRSALEKNIYELEYSEYELKKQVEQNNRLVSDLKQAQRRIERLKVQLQQEKEKNDDLQQQLNSMSASSCTSTGAMERLVSSSETSLEMSKEEEEEMRERQRQREEEDEVHNYRGSDSLGAAAVAAGQSAAVAAAASIDAAQLRSCLMNGSRIADEDELETSRKGDTASPLEFELRRSASDMGPSTHHRLFEGAPEEMAALEGGSWRRREKRRSFVKRTLMPPTQESESSDGERMMLTEKQLRKKGSVVKYDPNRRVIVKEKHYKRFGKPERTALKEYTFLEHEVTDVSGMLSSPSEGNY